MWRGRVACTPRHGWWRRARYAHSMRVFVFNSGLFYIRPTPAALDLLDRLVHRVETENGWDQAIFNEARLRQLLRRGHVQRLASLAMMGSAIIDEACHCHSAYQT